MFVKKHFIKYVSLLLSLVLFTNILGICVNAKNVQLLNTNATQSIDTNKTQSSNAVLIENFNAYAVGNVYAGKTTENGWCGKTNEDIDSSIIRQNIGDNAYNFTTDKVNNSYYVMTGIKFDAVDLPKDHYIALYFEHDSNTDIKLEFAVANDHTVHLNHYSYSNNQGSQNGYLVYNNGVTASSFNCNWKVNIPANYSGWLVLPVNAFGCDFANKFMLYARGDDTTTQKKITYTWDDLYIISDIDVLEEISKPIPYIAIEDFNDETLESDYWGKVTETGWCSKTNNAP